MRIPNWFIEWYNEWWVRHDQYTNTRIERERQVAYTAYLKGKKDAKKWVTPDYRKKAD